MYQNTGANNQQLCLGVFPYHLISLTDVHLSPGDQTLALLLRILAAASVALLSLAALLKIAWAFTCFRNGVLGILSSTFVILAGNQRYDNFFSLIISANFRVFWYRFVCGTPQLLLCV
jgi:hypothetical protein